jgi:hypothetical protein
MPEDKVQILTFAVHDASAVQVIRTDLNHDSIAGNDSNEVLTHLAGNVCHHLMTILEFDPELCVRQSFHHTSFYLNCFFLWHFEFLSCLPV